MLRRLLLRISLWAWVFWLLPWQPALAGGDPTLIWQTIETPHFTIYFYQGEYLIAMKTARVAEEAHERVTELLGHTPKDKTVIVVTDETDGANGSATVIPYNLVRIFVTAPSEDSVLSDYDDWLRGLIYHEYTHIVHIDTIGGLPRFTNKFTGKIWAPNQIEPRWFIEGLATYAESALTTAGRANSTARDMFLRAATLEGRMLSLDQLSSAPLSWPRGNSFYLFGSAFLNYIADRFGHEALVRFSHQYGKTAVPYGLNKIAKDTIGEDFVTLHSDWQKFLDEKYQKQKADIEAAGRIEGVRLTITGEDHNSPLFSPDGQKLYFYEASGQRRAGIYVADFGPESEARKAIQFATEATINEAFSSTLLTPTSGRSAADFSPDGSVLYLHQRMVTKNFYSYNDLYRYDLDTDNFTRLTKAERASDPSVSPDGKWIAYAQNRSGSSSLALVSVDAPTKPILLVEETDFSQVFTPTFSPDGKTIAFSLWQAGGFRDIALVNVETKEVKTLMYDRAIDTDPTFSADGKILYFSSDRTGVQNVFAYDFAEEKLYQVTNVLNGAYEPKPSPDGKVLVYLGYNSYGFDLYALPIDRSTWREAPPSRVRDTPAYADEPLVHEKEASLPVKRYTPFKTIRPYTYTPIVAQDAYGGTAGLSIAGADAAGLHAFALTSQFSTVNGSPTYSLSYRYDGLYPTISASLSRFTLNRRVFMGLNSMPYVETQNAFNVSAFFPFRGLFWFSGISFRYEAQYVQPDDPNLLSTLPYDPGDVLPVYPDKGLISGVSATATFSNVRRYTFSISPEEGFSASLTGRVRDPILGSAFESRDLIWGLDQYLPLRFLGKHHVLALSCNGGVSYGEGRVSRSFVAGGLPTQDVFGALTLLTPGFVGGGFLRGFAQAAFVGDRFTLFNVEYRFPIKTLERGFGTIPLYARRIHGRLFTDYGGAFFGEVMQNAREANEDPNVADAPFYTGAGILLPAGMGGQMHASVGAELLMDGIVGYFLGTTVRLGVAQGLGAQGIRDFYLLVGAPF